jgi:hypothetical protein
MKGYWVIVSVVAANDFIIKEAGSSFYTLFNVHVYV